MSLFQGAGVALITPFTEENQVNYHCLEELIEFQIASGTDALIVCGTTGEPATMTEEERLSVIRFAVEKTAGRIPVIAGSGSNNTVEAASFSKKAEELGVDGLLVVTPYYNKATQRGLYEHYKYLASKVKLPIIMYNVQSRTGCNLLPETAVALARDCENIVGIKEASGNISQVAHLAQLGQGVLDIYSGNDDQILPILSLGGIGVISVLSNVIPKETHDLVQAFLEGNLEEARRLQLSYLDLANTLFCEVNPIPVKAAVSMLGFPAGNVRLPLTSIEEPHRQLLEKEMRKLNLYQNEW